MYTIKPEKGRGKSKRVHRNDIMRCNELLSKEPVVPVKTAVETSKPKASIKSKTAASTDVPEKVPDTVGEEESDSEELLGVVRSRGAEEVLEEADIEDSGALLLSEEVDDEPEEVLQVEPPQDEISDAQENSDDPDDSLDESDQSSASSSPSVPTRTSSRMRTQTKRLTYHVAGGDPTYS